MILFKKYYMNINIFYFFYAENRYVQISKVLLKKTSSHAAMQRPRNASLEQALYSHGGMQQIYTCE